MRRSSKASASRSAAPADAAGFRPTNAQIAYAVAFADAVAAGQPVTDIALSAQIKVSRSQVCRWRESDAFIEWLERATARTFQRGRTHVLARAYHLALRGSIKHMELFLRYSPDVKDPNALPAPLGGGTVNAAFLICVPRPDGAVPADAIRHVGSGQA